MKTVVIVGTGKAAKLHYLSYKKFLNSNLLFFVDPFHKTNYSNILIYNTLKEFLNNTKYSPDEVIVDICTPCSVFYSIIKDCKLNGFTNIIVEKPFVTRESDFESHLFGLNICMVQNYLYSNITKEIKQIMCDNNLQIKNLVIDFSKNRIVDSFNNRGMYKEQTTSVFEVEFPHELYIADYLLNLNDNFKISNLKIKDMFHDGKILKNHGYGQIVGKQDDKNIVLKSDLMHFETVKKVKIAFDDGKFLEANYLIYDKNLHLLNNGNIFLQDNEHILYQKEFLLDDNMLECLKDFYYYFSGNKYDVKYKLRILSFSNLMKMIKEKEMVYEEGKQV